MNISQTHLFVPFQLYPCRHAPESTWSSAEEQKPGLGRSAYFFRSLFFNHIMMQIYLSSLAPWSHLLFSTFFLILHPLSSFPVTFPPLLHVSCLASLLSRLLRLSPVTLEGFNHQLNVTPCLWNTHTHIYTHWWSYTFSEFFYFTAAKAGRSLNMEWNCWAMFAYGNLLGLDHW